jgi:hypothetical protein
MTCSVAEYAERLSLPPDYLIELGLTDNRRYGGSVRIPYTPMPMGSRSAPAIW